MNSQFSRRRRRVLVVDDEFINRQMLGFILNSEYDVTYASNGCEALQILKDETGFSLVMLDLLMPEMDGFEFLRIRQNDEHLRTIPVIVLTAEKEAELRSLKLGAIDFIKKPYDMPEVILARVERVVELMEDRFTIEGTERDKLTGLYNIQYFYEYISQRESFFPNRVMDIGVLNIEKFHTVNELYGRAFGDKVLRAMGQILEEYLVEYGGIACRKEADSFYLYFSHQKEYDEIIGRFQEELHTRIPQTKIRIRMGVYLSQDSSMEIERRCDRAKLACDSVRGDYTRAFALYDVRLHEDVLRAQKLINEMDRALLEHQFQVFYQPKYDIRGEIPVLCGAEALIRWEHPEMGMLGPGAFIPLFEENGLIRKIDEYMRREVARQARAWKQTYDVTLPISVNVSRIDFYDPELEDNLRGVVREFQLERGDMHLEVTESAYSRDYQYLNAVVTRLHESDFEIEMDDFGSGYSSLGALKELPVDILKLDRGLICDIHINEKSLQLVKAILEICRFMGFETLAEGVEEEAQYRLLKEAGCSMIQGWYFSRPLRAERFEELIRTSKEKGE